MIIDLRNKDGVEIVTGYYRCGRDNYGTRICDFGRSTN